MRAVACLGLAALFSISIFPQSNEKPLAFDAADVHFSGSALTGVRGPFIAGGRYEVRSASMLDLVVAAYGVDADKVVGGPDWMEADRFNVIAKAPAGTTTAAMKTMLRTLLADRFKLVAHNDNKPQQAYALTVGKKALLKAATDSAGETGCKPAPLTPGTSAVSFSCRNMTMEAFAEGMRTMPYVPSFLGGLRVVDRTDLKGAWDFEIKFNRFLAAMLAAAAAGEEKVTIFDALQKQLGLELTRSDVPMPVLVVDSVNRRPSENLPDIAQRLPALPAQFDVADTTPPDSGRGTVQLHPGGRVTIEGMTLQVLIRSAWGLPTNEYIVGPKFLDTARFTIIAKAPVFGAAEASGIATRAGVAQAAQMDNQSVYPLLRSLLIDRFSIVAHNEDRPVTTFVLTVVKAKLQPANPANRTTCHSGPGPDGKDPRTTNRANGMLETCLNMTMAQFVENLNGFAPGYIQQAPVVDATGLEGAWDFTLNYAIAGSVGGGGAGGDSTTPAATEPTAPDIIRGNRKAAEPQTANDKTSRIGPRDRSYRTDAQRKLIEEDYAAREVRDRRECRPSVSFFRTTIVHRLGRELVLPPRPR